MSVGDSVMGSSSGRNEWFKILVRQVFFLFVSGYPPPTAWITKLTRKKRRYSFPLRISFVLGDFEALACPAARNQRPRIARRARQ
jgi:hypothetical protein